jgi:hypothetical protein
VTLIEDLAVTLEDLGYADVQRFVLQDQPDVCVALTPRDPGIGRTRSEFVYGQEAPARATFRVLVQVRGDVEVPDEPATRADAIWKALHRQLATLNGTLYRTVTPLQTPLLLKQDNRRRCVYVFHVDVVPDAV